MDYLGLLVSWNEYWTDLGTGHYLSPGGGGGGGGIFLGETRWNLADPPIWTLLQFLDVTSVMTDPTFCSPKNEVMPPKILRPLPPGDK